MKQLFILLLAVSVVQATAQSLKDRVIPNDPSKYRELSAVHAGAGKMGFTQLIGRNDLSTNFLYLHTGVINAIKHAQSLTGQSKIHFVMGGFHLAGNAVDNRIDPTIEDLKALQPHYLVTGHCTGRKTQANLSDVFASRHIPYGVGAYLRFGT